MTRSHQFRNLLFMRKNCFQSDNVFSKPAEERADLNLKRLFVFVFDANVLKVFRIDVKRNDVSYFSRQRVDDRQDVRLSVLYVDEGDRADVVVVDALSFVEQGGTRRLVFAQRILKCKKCFFKLCLTVIKVYVISY
jgi:hypothetical protein